MSTRLKSQRLAILIGLVAVVPGDLPGQSSRDTGQSSLRQRLEMLEAGTRLRLHAGTQLEEGRLVLRTLDSVGLRFPAGEVHRSLDEVDSLWIRKNHVSAGLLVGALTGAGAYLLVTGLNESNDNEDLDNFFGGLIWAGSVALGAVVGALTPRWKRVYP
jgi:hypothetical protein